ncbi:hypothetical protein M378DRAFT_964363 [Amanita muscaria Koide BX008]|uniref:Uncharacterized protein n=1 Tax=Amanita muscaria (strain Koide BX008) TaxID=946122 RepID=A0A0C2WT01_AMAMK|nr:hypothetical protein M378DRAFT_964363 [Amanita muscaria Koide BX008]
MVSYPDASTIATTVHAVFFGVYIATFFQCLRWLIFVDEGWTKRNDIKWTILIVTLMIFALSTADLSICLWGTLLSVTETFNSSSVFQLVVESITTIIIDGILIFRCWIVCNKSWRVVSGLLFLLLCNIACLAVMTYWASLQFAAQKKQFHVQIVRLHEVFLVCNIIIDVYATSAIILQIRQTCFSRHLLHFATRIVAESGRTCRLAAAKDAHKCYSLSHRRNYFQCYSDTSSLSQR